MVRKMRSLLQRSPPTSPGGRGPSCTSLTPNITWYRVLPTRRWSGPRYAIGAALRLRSEEANGGAEPVLVCAVSRMRWVTSHLAFAFLGPAVVLGAAGLAAGLAYGLSAGDVGRETTRVLEAALVQLPAVWVLVGVAVACSGCYPG